MGGIGSGGANGGTKRYSPELADTICEQLASGRSLNAICKEQGMPHESAVRWWVVEDYAGFATKYSRARDVGFDVVAESVLAIADDIEGDPDPKSRQVRMAARQWWLGKMSKRYSDQPSAPIDVTLNFQAISITGQAGQVSAPAEQAAAIDVAPAAPALPRGEAGRRPRQYTRRSRPPADPPASK